MATGMAGFCAITGNAGSGAVVVGPPTVGGEGKVGGTGVEGVASGGIVATGIAGVEDAPGGVGVDESRAASGATGNTTVDCGGIGPVVGLLGRSTIGLPAGTRGV